MAFCKFSSEVVNNTKTELDDVFIIKFMPDAPDNCIKVYLYGLYLCKSTNVFENNLENFAKELALEESEIIACFSYWQEQGLVQLLSTNPIEIRFTPLNNIFAGRKLFKPDKYENFNKQAQELFANQREITKTEYGEYYDFLERYHMEQAALIMIMQYCILTKKQNIGYPYILTVAKNWANEGVLTIADLEEKLCSFEELNTDIQAVFKVLNIKRASFIEEKNLFKKWINELGFNLDVILYLAQKIKLKRGASFEKIDNFIMKYYSLSLFSILEIEEYEAKKDSLYEIAKTVNSCIGVYYENLETVVENYISPWVNLGFESQAILDIATYCRKASIRTLEGVDNKIQKFFKLGILTTTSLQNYFSEVVSKDSQIKSILENCGIVRNVNFIDRELFKTWTESWNLSESLINYATELANGKTQPLQYMNTILSNWFNNKISTVEQAKKVVPFAKTTIKNENFEGRSYKKEDFTALIQSIDEVDI